jgi:hypothetical protein
MPLALALAGLVDHAAAELAHDEVAPGQVVRAVGRRVSVRPRIIGGIGIG